MHLPWLVPVVAGVSASSLVGPCGGWGKGIFPGWFVVTAYRHTLDFSLSVGYHYRTALVSKGAPIFDRA